MKRLWKWYIPPEDPSKGAFERMKGRYQPRQPRPSKIKPHLHLSSFHHLLRFARCLLRLLIKFPLAVRFVVVWEHLQRRPRCSRSHSGFVLFFFFLSGMRGKEVYKRRWMKGWKESTDVSAGRETSFHGKKKFLYCIKMRNTARGCFGVRADAEA